MDAYGLNLEGKFVVEKVPSRPSFSEDQIGRFIFVEDNETYWVGGLNKWLSFGLSDGTVKDYNIDWGKEYGQIHAGSIPYLDETYRYIDATTVEEALLELARGDGLADESVTERIIGEESIKNYHISWGTDGDNVGAKDISINSEFRGSKGVTTIGNALNRVEQNCPIIIRKIVQPTAWEIVPADELYHVSVTITPIDNPFVIVQCYELTGKQIIPARITTDLSTSKVHIYMPNPSSLTIVVVG